MTLEQVAEMHGVPQFAGLPFYPGGAPVRLEDITWCDGETLQEKWLKHCTAVVNDTAPHQEDESLLKNWVIYYLHAPMWQWCEEAFEYGVGRILSKDMLQMTLNELTYECLEIGLDPL